MIDDKSDIREVYFDKYCKLCVHKDKEENEEPCDECLTNPVNTNCQRPVMFKEKEYMKVMSKIVGILKSSGYGIIHVDDNTVEITKEVGEENE